MFLHQVHNSIGGNVFNAFLYSDIAFPTHLHKAYELALVLSGEAEAAIGKQKYLLGAGEYALVTPYQLHSYKTPEKSLVYVVVFDGGYVETFSRRTKGKDAENAVLRPSPETHALFCRYMLHGETVSGASLSVPVKKPRELTLKACLYAVCSEFYERTAFSDHPADNTVLFDMLSYVENNFTADISLRTMAEALGYDYRYLSRVFCNAFGVGYKTMVNQYRCDFSKTLILSTDRSLADIAMDSGFQSIKTFNRVFLEFTGETPSRFRKRKTP